MVKLIQLWKSVPISNEIQNRTKQNNTESWIWNVSNHASKQMNSKTENNQRVSKSRIETGRNNSGCIWIFSDHLFVKMVNLISNLDCHETHRYTSNLWRNITDTIWSWDRIQGSALVFFSTDLQQILLERLRCLTRANSSSCVLIRMIDVGWKLSNWYEYNMSTINDQTFRTCA